MIVWPSLLTCDSSPHEPKKHMDLTRYRNVLTTPGLARLLSSSIVARLPSAMLGIAVILRITGNGGSYSLAGLVGGATAGAAGITGPLWSRLVDRTGQTAVLLGTAVVFAAMTGVLALVPTDVGWLLIVVGVAAGAFVPPIAGSARALWPHVVTDHDQLESTYAVDSTFQEVTYIAGPLLVVAVAAPLGAQAAIVATGALGLIGTVLFATSPHSRRWRGARGPRIGGSALSVPTIRLLVATVFAVVIAFGATEVAIVAAAGGNSDTGLVGVLLALWSGGSLIGGLVYGSRGWPGSLGSRLISLLAATALLTGAVAAAGGTVAIGALLVASGAMCAPAFACIYFMAQRFAASGTATESFAWLATGAVAGGAVGSALGGLAVNAGGASAGFTVAASVMVLATLVAAGGRRLFRTDPLGATA